VLRLEKNRSNCHRKTYCNIKALKIILKIEGVDNYMLKKLLLRPAKMRSKSESDFFYEMLCLPELKEKFGQKLSEMEKR
jgi:hypothetical protein